jgi:uncharacterized protein (TIGR02001 family)
MQLGYDSPSGLYLNAAAIGALGRDADLYFLGVQGNIGYTQRLAPQLYIDGGVVHSEYDPIAPNRDHWRVTEIYLGLGTDEFTGRISYSPHYFISHTSTLYAEAEAAFEPAPEWRLNAHVGALLYLESPYFFRHDAYYDWRLGASRRLGNFDIHAAVSGGGPGKDYYGSKPRNRTAVTVGASWSF